MFFVCFVCQAYPYTAESDLCKKSTCDVVEGTMVDKWIDVDHDSEEVRLAFLDFTIVTLALRCAWIYALYPVSGRVGLDSCLQLCCFSVPLPHP